MKPDTLRCNTIWKPTAPQHRQKHYYAFFQQNNVRYDVFNLNCSWRILAVIVLHCNTCSMGWALISSIFLLSQLSERWPNIMEPHNWKLICIQCIFGANYLPVNSGQDIWGQCGCQESEMRMWAMGQIGRGRDSGKDLGKPHPGKPHSVYLANFAWYLVMTAD